MSKLIVCCGMPRSGSTLHYQMVKAIVENAKAGLALGFPRTHEINNALKYNQYAVVKSETYRPELLEHYDIIAFGIIRDFRDIVVSLRDFYNRRAEFKRTIDRWTAKEVIAKEASRIIYDYYMWSQLTDHWPKYENVIKSPQQEADNIASKLQLPSCDISHLTVNKAKEFGDNMQQWIDDEETMLTARHVSKTKGKSRWKKELNKSDLELIDLVAGKWQKKNDYL